MTCRISNVGFENAYGTWYMFESGMLMLTVLQRKERVYLGRTKRAVLC